MKKILLLCIPALLFCGELFSQLTINATQYIIKIQSYQPNDYSYYNNVGYSRQYLLYDQAGVNTGTVNGYGFGNQTHEFYVSEAKRPDKLTAKHSVNYQTYYCETYDPNCDGGVNEVRMVGNKKPGKGDTVQQGNLRQMVEQPNCGTCWWQPSSFYTLYLSNIPLKYPMYDTTIQYYGNSITISVRPAGDQNYNLPSSDNISIQAEGDVTGFVWEYQLLGAGTTNWSTLPASLIRPGGAEAILNGQLLFGGSWMSHINKTVLFRLRNTTTGLTSNILLYTHRLSSPRIVSVEAFQNPCYGYDTAYIKIKFDRLLITDEKVNIFLKDTALGLDYSALNLSNANIDPSTYTYTWPRELVQGGYKISLIGKYFDYATYTGSPGHFAFTKITDPELVRFYLSQQPALCYGGDNGKVIVAAKGGVGNYKYELLPDETPFSSTWTSFSNTVYNPQQGTTDLTKNGMSSRLYKVRVRDGNDCMNRDSLGREIYRTIPVKQPEEALNLSLLTVSPITAHNLTNGAITVRISGGTPFVYNPEAPTQKKYSFEWRDSITNALISNFTLDTNGKFETRIQNLAEGTYRFEAWDASYTTGNYPYNQQGCRVNIYIRITKPQPLNVSVVTASKVKCYGEQNAELKALPTGGIPVSDSLKYNFTWYRENGGSFTNLNVNDSVLRNVGAGNYRVDIADKFSNVKQSNLYTLTQPTVLDATVTTNSPTCYFSPNGTMTATASGGTAPYLYEWSTGHLTPSVTGVAGGNYVLVIKDTSLCLVTKQVTVTSPGKINTLKTITPVGCNGSSSGAISLTASGGTPGYSYLWSNGSTSPTASNLAAGRYWYRITDSKSCFDTDTIDLDIPEAYTVSAGADRKICIGQQIVLKASISQTIDPLTASWSTPQGTVNGKDITVTSAGTYIVTVTNSTGCQKKDTVLVTFENAAVNTSFTVSTQAFAGENTTLVNISSLPQDSAYWILPANSGITQISQSKSFCELKFSDTGHFSVGIRAFYNNGCIDEKFKDVHVVRKEIFGNIGNQADAFLKQFSLFPNPTSGAFTLNLLFNSVTVARVRIINILTNTTISDKYLQGGASYSEQYNVGSQPAGTYVVVIETPKGNFVHKLNKL